MLLGSLYQQNGLFGSAEKVIFRFQSRALNGLPIFTLPSVCPQGGWGKPTHLETHFDGKFELVCWLSMPKIRENNVALEDGRKKAYTCVLCDKLERRLRARSRGLSEVCPA